MKALLLSAVVFFSLRAMAGAEVGEDMKGECKNGPQASRELKPKEVTVEDMSTANKPATGVQK